MRIGTALLFVVVLALLVVGALLMARGKVWP